MPDEAVKEAVRYSVDQGKQILVHCNGDAASEQFLNAYEDAVENSGQKEKNSLRPVMIHCQTVRNDQLDRMARLNIQSGKLYERINQKSQLFRLFVQRLHICLRRCRHSFLHQKLAV